MILVIDGVNESVKSVECNAMKEWKLSIFNIVDKRIKFYSQNTNLLPPNNYMEGSGSAKIKKT